MIDDALKLAEAERCLQGLITFGTVEAADYPAARLRVRFSKTHVSGWLPWLTPRAAGGERVWDAPEVGEKVVVLAPGGAMETGCVLGALFSPESPAPPLDQSVQLRRHADGGFDRYDREASARTIDLPASGTFTVKVGSTTLVLRDGAADLTADAINLTGAETITLQSGAILLDSPSIDLGEGGEPVARKDDPVAGGKIASGSMTVRSA